MSLSREIDLKLRQRYTKTDIHEMWYTNQSFKQILDSEILKIYDNPVNDNRPYIVIYVNISSIQNKS